MTNAIENTIYPVPQRLLTDKKLPKPFISSFEGYKQKWQESVDNPSKFFGNVKYNKKVRVYKLIILVLSLPRSYYIGQNHLKQY